MRSALPSSLTPKSNTCKITLHTRTRTCARTRDLGLLVRLDELVKLDPLAAENVERGAEREVDLAV